MNGSARCTSSWSTISRASSKATWGRRAESNSELFTADEAAIGPTDPFVTFDLSAGFGKDNWTFSVFAQNLFDDRGVLSKNTDCVVSICGGFPLDYLTKPRFVGAKISAKFD